MRRISAIVVSLILLVPGMARSQAESVTLVHTGSSGDTAFVEVRATATHIRSASLAFIIDTTVLEPAAPLVRSHSFAHAQWNVFADTVFVGLASADPAPFPLTPDKREEILLREVFDGEYETSFYGGVQGGSGASSCNEREVGCSGIA